MAQYTSLDKKNSNKSIIPSSLSLKIKEIIHPLLLKIARSKNRYKMVRCSEYDSKKVVSFGERPLIYVGNHATCYDVPSIFTAIDDHAVILAGKQPLEKMDETFFNLNGTIYVDRKNKEDMKLSKEAVVGTLKKKKNILIFPEGTWNMTDSKPMLEMKWGVIDIAQQANALIVPIALDYDYDNNICRYIVGDPIDVNNLSLKDGIQLLRDVLSTLRWSIFEQKDRLQRDSVNIEEERKKIMNSVSEYPKLDYEYEKSIVFRSYPTADEIFEPLKKLK